MNEFNPRPELVVERLFRLCITAELRQGRAMANVKAMMASIIESRDKLAAEQARLRAELAQVEMMLSSLNQLIHHPELLTVIHTEGEAELPTAFEAFDPQRAGKRGKSNSRKEEVAEAARAEIALAGRPIPRADLFELLKHRENIVIRGQSPITVMSTMLWRTKEMPGVVFLKGHGYWLAEKDWIPARYYPQGPDLLKPI